MNHEEVILVDENDQATGTMEKLQAHKEGKLHRAFSVFIFNSEGKLLLQQRAKDKYHSPLLWTNTCCSHPRTGEVTKDAAERRLKEEMGFSCELEHAFSFIYKADMQNGLTEHEFDHVFFGSYNMEPKPFAAEVENWKYADMREIYQHIKQHPENYTAWFKIVFDRVYALKK